MIPECNTPTGTAEEPLTALLHGPVPGHAQYDACHATDGAGTTSARRDAGGHPRLAVRTATPDDLPRLHAMAGLAVQRILAGRHYTVEQMRVAVRVRVHEVEPTLVRAGTYYVVEIDGAVAACCGWSPGGALRPGGDRAVTPGTAAMRAAYVDPAWARRGLATLVVRTAETAAVVAGFRRLEAICTPPSEAMLRSMGYGRVGQEETPLGGGVTLPTAHMRKELET